MSSDLHCCHHRRRTGRLAPFLHVVFGAHTRVPARTRKARAGIRARNGLPALHTELTYPETIIRPVDSFRVSDRRPPRTGRATAIRKFSLLTKSGLADSEPAFFCHTRMETGARSAPYPGRPPYRPFSLVLCVHGCGCGCAMPWRGRSRGRGCPVRSRSRHGVRIIW